MSRIPRIAAIMASAAFLLVCLVYAWSNSVFVCRYWFRMAHLDQTRWEIAYLANGLWYTLTHQFNEHRVVLLSLVTHLDWKFTQGSMVLLQSVSLLCQAATFVWLFLPLLRSGLPRPVLAVLGGTALVWATWLGQCENLCWPVQFPVFFCNLCGVAASWHLARRLTAHSTETTWGQALRAGAPSAIWAVLATFNYANGVLTWIPLAFIAMTRRRWRLGILFVALLATTLGIYLIDYHSPKESVDPFGSLLHRPLHVATFLTVIMARPLLPAWLAESLTGRVDSFLTVANMPWVWVAGLAVVAAFAWWIARQLVCREVSFEELFYVPVAMMMFGTALVTAIGRIRLGLQGALASRYGTIELVLYFCLAALVACAIFRSRPAPATVALWGGAMAALIAVSWPAGQELAAFCRERAFQMRLMTYALRMNVYNLEQAQFMFEFPTIYNRTLERKRELRIGVFADSSIAPIGQTLAATAIATRCDGAVERSSPVPSASSTSLFVGGWAWNQYEDRAIDEYLLIEPGSNTIVGVGVGASLRLDKDRRRFTSGWFAYTQPRQKHVPYTVAGRIGDNRYCTIGTVQPPN